ncbi:MAG TPA: ABC transporter permease [Gemmatimonadales bacterium]|nr:ABC transporter permease [Gemmatimonadales bacterium]
MIRYTAKRLLQAIPLLLGILTITFFIIRLAPGDPMDMYLEPTRQRQLDPEVIELIRQKYGLDQPLHIQYVKWVANVARGEFGESFRHRRPVNRILAEAIPYTLQLTVLALLFDALVGIALGILSAVKQYSLLDKTVTLGSLIIYAIPGFWLALMLVLVFSVHLGWFPTSQTRSMDYEFLTAGQQVMDRLWHLVLPVFVLGIASAAGTARYMRSRLLEVLNEEYVVAARARGFRERTVILKHALRNALIPIITIYGLALPFLLGGATIIETIFAWPGMGRLTVEAVGGRDYPVIMATTTLAATLTVIGNLLADITYAAVDPRVSFEGRSRA